MLTNRSNWHLWTEDCWEDCSWGIWKTSMKSSWHFWKRRLYGCVWWSLRCLLIGTLRLTWTTVKQVSLRISSSPSPKITYNEGCLPTGNKRYLEKINTCGNSGMMENRRSKSGGKVRAAKEKETLRKLQRTVKDHWLGKRCSSERLALAMPTLSLKN